MEKTLFCGACTALVTPFLEGKVNYPMVEQLLRRQIDAGVPAVVIAGTTGESSTLSDKEKLELFRRCRAYAEGRCKIIAGTGSNDTFHAAALSQESAETGVDGLLVVSPYYNKTTEDGLIAHFMTIAHSVDLPIILYNGPSRTGVDIPIAVYKRLSAIPNIVGVKEASTDITKLLRIRNSCPPDFSIWTGNDDQTVAAIASGAQGVISVLSNVLPEQTHAMALAALDGDFDTAVALQCDLLPLIDKLFCEVNPIPVKEAMRILGFDCGGYRLPLTPMSSDKAQALAALLKNMY